jgi:antitoxin PrlF
MPLARLSSKSQIVLPAEIRIRLNIRPGDLLEITAKEEYVTIHKAPVSFATELDGCAADYWQGYSEELRKERDQWDG